MTLPHDTKNAIIHLGNLLERDNLIYSTVGFGSVGVATFLGGNCEETIRYDTHDPIKAALDNVLQEACTDCLKLEYYFAEPFFTSLIKGYIEVLITQYGGEIAITKTMAYVCLKYDLTQHEICYKDKDGQLYKVDEDAEQFNIETTNWFLKVKDGNRKT